MIQKTHQTAVIPVRNQTLPGRKILTMKAPKVTRNTTLRAIIRTKKRAITMKKDNSLMAKNREKSIKKQK